MDFFKSVLSEDAEPADSDSQTSRTSPPSSQSQLPNPEISDVSSTTNAWSFGSRWIRTLASKSESVIETYRRDLEDFSSGLRKETATIRQVAGRAMKDLPARLETGAAVAQESLESVGQAIDDIGSTVSEIIAQGKNSILDSESDNELYNNNNDGNEIGDNSRNLNANEKPYSRIDAMIRATQGDVGTYCEEPEGSEDYNEWKMGFSLEEKTGEIEELIQENKVIKDIYDDLVPSQVDRETFWVRYFYRVYRVLKAEEARAKLVKRAILGKEEEELSWDIDDLENEESNRSNPKGDLKKDIDEKDSLGTNTAEITEVECEQSLKRETDHKAGVIEIEPNNAGGFDLQEISEGKSDRCESSGGKLEVKSDEKACFEGRNDNGGSCKDSDFSVVSSQPSSRDEEDLGWDEIEDIGSGEESKVAVRSSPERADLRKRLSAADKEEDLTWDIEDDDEPVKS